MTESVRRNILFYSSRLAGLLYYCKNHCSGKFFAVAVEEKNVATALSTVPNGASRRADETSAVPLWEYHMYVTTASGSVTRIVLQSHRPLLAEQVLVMHIKLDSNGSPTSFDPTVGVNVALDWNEGWNFDPEF